MKNVRKFLALAALSLLGFTALEVKAESTAEKAVIDGAVATEAAASGCWRCDPAHSDKCQSCVPSGQSGVGGPGRTACSPSSNPLVLCTLLGTACTMDPCPG